MTQQMDLKVYIVFKLTKDYFKHIPFLLYGIKYVPILITSTTMKMSFFHQISQTQCALNWLLLILLGFVSAVSESEEYQTYIIHMDQAHKPASFLTHESWQHSILKSLFVISCWWQRTPVVLIQPCHARLQCKPHTLSAIGDWEISSSPCHIPGVLWQVVDNLHP